MSAVEQAVHAIELARRGCDLTGVGLSGSMLNRAREKAEESGIKVNFIQADARNLPVENEFDHAIMLCEGGFSLMEADETNFEILKQVTTVLKPVANLFSPPLMGCSLFSIQLRNLEEQLKPEARSSARTILLM